jgi:hypothetical protein
MIVQVFIGFLHTPSMSCSALGIRYQYGSVDQTLSYYRKEFRRLNSRASPQTRRTVRSPWASIWLRDVSGIPGPLSYSPARKNMIRAAHDETFGIFRTRTRIVLTNDIRQRWFPWRSIGVRAPLGKHPAQAVRWSALVGNGGEWASVQAKLRVRHAETTLKRYRGGLGRSGGHCVAVVERIW